ncbi:MAG: hypothetical protein Q9215_005171, partial [Flavoplaca cf. flavocitrina]
ASESDVAYADRFAALAEAVDACAHAEDVVLLLSTCRNSWMTVNAQFKDLRIALGAGQGHDLISVALYELRRDGFETARSALGKAGAALAEVKGKGSVWGNREALMEEFEAAVEGLSLRDRRRLELLIKRQEQPTVSLSHASHASFLALDLREVPEAQPAVREIAKAAASLTALVSVGLALLDLLRPTPISTPLPPFPHPLLSRPNPTSTPAQTAPAASQSRFSR